MALEESWTDVPELVPVRMLNEHVYCPRLAHIEWVQQLFADNRFTVDGRWQHRAVDESVGAAPLPDEGELRSARAVELSSRRLGLIGKADIVDGRGGAVVPVDVKRGRPAQCPERVWLPERVQVCALGLLLRENGFRCDEGAVFFVETRERVPVPMTEELIELTLAALEELRAAAALPEAPPPLVDSPKCDGCSLVGICLPDEVPFLRRERVEAPRRLMPADGAGRPLYVMEPGAYLGKDGGRLVVTKKREKLDEIRLVDLSQVCVYGNVQVSTQLVRELMSREIPVCWFSRGGWLNGITEGLPAKNVELRRRQVTLAEDGALDIARAMIEGKIRNCRTLLRRNTQNRSHDALESLRRLERRAATASDVPSLLGYEGTAARLYFSQFPTMLRGAVGGTFSFTGRNRRPPTDPVNALLSFVYGLLTKDCVATLRSVGFDPYSGFLHRPRFGRPALALDLAEEMRPLIADSVVITAVNNGEIAETDFLRRAGGVSLTQDGRRAVLRTYERRLESEVTHPIFGYRCTWRRIIEGSGPNPGGDRYGRGRSVRPDGHPVVAVRRSRYLVAYDIRDPRRLRLVHRTMKAFGSAVQYSVFVCDLTPAELCDLRFAIREVYKESGSPR